MNEVPKELWIRISADSRYKLYVNQEFVEYGPAKGDTQIWYYDEINIAPWLQTGSRRKWICTAADSGRVLWISGNKLEIRWF